nr:MAG TPA: hypothetical protein [Bacteriophage sp.]
MKHAPKGGRCRDERTEKGHTKGSAAVCRGACSCCVGRGDRRGAAALRGRGTLVRPAAEAAVSGRQDGGRGGARAVCEPQHLLPQGAGSAIDGSGGSGEAGAAIAEMFQVFFCDVLW